MTTLRLADNLALPVEAVTQTFALLAVRGSGKTYTAAVLVEELVKAGQPVVVIDPIGVWWGLRANAAGDGPGLPVAILGGDHADLPLDPHAGDAVAAFVADQGPALVLDLSLMRKGEQQRFVTAFAERLYHQNRRALHLVFDEADAFAPQRAARGQERMLGAMEDLVRRGRARGLGVTMITQRPAVLHKDLLTQIQVLICLRLVAPQDRAALDAWVQANGTAEQRADLMASLASLAIGEAWVWSPGWLGLFERVKIRTRETFDSSATPQAGEQRNQPRRLAAVDLEQLRGVLAASVEKAEQDDPKALRKRIAELAREVRAMRARPAPERAVERVEVSVIPDATRAVLRDGAQGLSIAAQGLAALAARMEGALSDLPGSGPPAAATPPPPSPGPRPRPPSRAPAGANLRAGERRMVGVLARHPGGLTRQQLATLSGFAVSGGTFGTYLGVLKREGLAEEAGGLLTPTAEALAVAGGPAPPATTREVLDLWRGSLRAGQRAMLGALVAAHPAGMTKRELAERSGYELSGGTFGTYLGVLRRNGLVDVAGDDVRASATLFLGG